MFQEGKVQVFNARGIFPDFPTSDTCPHPQRLTERSAEHLAADKPTCALAECCMDVACLCTYVGTVHIQKQGCCQS